VNIITAFKHACGNHHHHDHLRDYAGKVLVFSEVLAALDVLATGFKKEYDYDCIAYSSLPRPRQKPVGPSQELCLKSLQD